MCNISSTFRLNYCELSERSCASLATALKSKTSNLRELDLSYNKLKDSGVQLLSTGLESPHCRLMALRYSIVFDYLSFFGVFKLVVVLLKFSSLCRLICCLITGEGCSSVASALKSNPSHLKDLDLTHNKLQDSGVQILSAGLKSPQCRLETLR